MLRDTAWDSRLFPGRFCTVCDRDVDRLVMDAPGTPQEAWMCVDCRDCTEIMASDVRFLVDPAYDLADISESQASYMRRMHTTLLGRSRSTMDAEQPSPQSVSRVPAEEEQ